MPLRNSAESSDDSDDGGVNIEAEIDTSRAERARRTKEVVTPGETVTDDPQWMR